MKRYRVRDIEQLKLEASDFKNEVQALMKTPGGLKVAVEEAGFEPLIRIEDEQKMVVSEVGLKVEVNEIWFFVRQRIYGIDRFEEMEIGRWGTFMDEAKINEILSSLLVAANNPSLLAWRKLTEEEAGLYW